MYVIKLLKNLFYSGHGSGTKNKDSAIMFYSKSEANKYANDLGGKVIKKPR